MDYETQEAYQKSGIRFFTENWEPINKLIFDANPQSTYDYAEYILINRDEALAKENQYFVEIAIKNYGWSLLEELFKSEGRKYRMGISRLLEIE